MPKAIEKYIPKPLFATLDGVKLLYKSCREQGKAAIEHHLRRYFSDTLPAFATDDYHAALHFLYSYRGSLDTFNAYRREIEKLLQWCWFIHGDAATTLKRLDIEAFIEFCMKPDRRWIQTKPVNRFVERNGESLPNPAWRPFVVKVSKKAFQDGQKPDKAQFHLSQQGLRALFAVLSSFYQYLIQEELSASNPVSQIRQKSKFMQTRAAAPVIRRLSETQWQTVMDTAYKMRDADPEHERTVFMLHAMHDMYLRVSELTARPQWTPTMGDFFRDTQEHWWFKTVGKGNKLRQIAVGPNMLRALKNWRKHLELSPLPAPGESLPLVPGRRSKTPIKSTRSIRRVIQACFDKAVIELSRQSPEEAEMLRMATVHWLRHTGISEDVKIRPREHVRDDAGHSSGAITDRYIDVELQERAKSAQKK